MTRLSLLLISLSLTSCSHTQTPGDAQLSSIVLDHTSFRPSDYAMTYDIQCKRAITVSLRHRFGVDPDLMIVGIKLAGFKVSQADLEKINIQIESLGLIGAVFVPDCGWLNSDGPAKIDIALKSRESSVGKSGAMVLETEFDDEAKLLSLRH